MKDNCILFEIIQIYLWKKSRVTIYVLHDLFIAPVISFRCNKYWEKQQQTNSNTNNYNQKNSSQMNNFRENVIKIISFGFVYLKNGWTELFK